MLGFSYLSFNVNYEHLLTLLRGDGGVLKIYQQSPIVFFLLGMRQTRKGGTDQSANRTYPQSANQQTAS